MLRNAEQLTETVLAEARRILTECEESRQIGTMPLPSSPENRENRISSMGWLSASMVHDLRNPLGSVLACAQMLLDLDPSPACVKRLATNIYCAARRMREMLADIAGEDKSAPEICTIRDIVTAAWDSAIATAEGQHVRILNDVSGAVEILLQRSRMERVFFNLISNSLEAMPRGGSIHVTLRKADQCAFIAVEDTGTGIPVEISDRLFEPFVTAGKKDGLGLGLAFSRRTVRDHGGDMWVEHARGARFVMRLPLKQQQEAVLRSFIR